MAKLVSKTYGDALFDLGVQECTIDSLYEEAEAVIDAFKSNSELSKLLNHPKIKKEEKKKVVENILKDFISKDMTGLLILMVSKDRQNKIVDMLEYFCKRVKEYKNVGIAYVTTAVALTEQQKKQVINRLLETTKYIKFDMNFDVDESLIGGMVIRIGDRVVDSSIKTKLDELSKNLRNIQIA